MPKCRDLAIFVVTIDRRTNRLLYPRACARGKKATRGLLALLLIALVVLTLYPLPALLVCYSEWLQKALISVHHVRTLFYGNLSDPSSYGLKLTHNYSHFSKNKINGCCIMTTTDLSGFDRKSRCYHRRISKLCHFVRIFCFRIP